MTEIKKATGDLTTPQAVNYADAAIGQLQAELREAERKAEKDRQYIKDLLEAQAFQNRRHEEMRKYFDDQRGQLEALELIAVRYAKVLESLSVIFSELGDPEEEDWVGKLSAKLGESGGKEVLDSYIRALLDQFGSEEGVERETLRRYVADLEGLFEFAARDKNGVCSVSVSDSEIVLTLPGLRLAMGRLAKHESVLLQRVREDFLATATNQEPLPVAD